MRINLNYYAADEVLPIRILAEYPHLRRDCLFRVHECVVGTLVRIEQKWVEEIFVRLNLLLLHVVQVQIFLQIVFEGFPHNLSLLIEIAGTFTRLFIIV